MGYLIWGRLACISQPRDARISSQIDNTMLRRVSNSLSSIPRVLAHPAFLLGASAAISAAYYLRELTLPYGLLDRWQSTHVTVRSMIGHNSGLQLAYVVTFAAVFLLYFLALWMVTIRSDRRMWTLVIIGAVAINLILLFQYPFDAIDIFDYIFRGRMQAIYGANPFYDLPNQFQTDSLYPYALWVYATSAYGPLWETITKGLSAISGDGVIANVIAYKLVALGGYAATSVAIALTVRRLAPARALLAVTMFAWNPLVVFSIAGNGHNDAVMTACMVLGFTLLSARRYTLAALAETVGALVKFISALLVPIVVVVALRSLPDWRARIRYLLMTGFACAALVAIAYAPYWRGGDILGLNRRTTLFTTSIPTLAHFFLSQSLGRQADPVVAYGALAATALFVAWQTWRAFRDDSPDSPMRAGLSVLLFYLLITCLWFQPWYLIWVMALAPLVFSWTLLRGSILFSITAHAQLPLFHFVLFPGHAIFRKPFTDLYEMLPTLGVCWAYFIVVGIVQLRHRTKMPHEA